MKKLAVVFACLLATIVVANRFVFSEPEANAPHFDSLRLAALATKLGQSDASQRQNVLDSFWKEVEGKMPLVEQKSDDQSYSWVTFL
jgi:hypothetical protein